jgi:hypothetical protein
MTLSEQYHSGVITPREFVESVWNIVVIQQGFPGRWEYVLSALYGQMIFRTESEAESAASAFTLKRLEEIRQVKEEIEQLEMVWASYCQAARIVQNRIIAARQAALVELCRGIKLEVLA